MCGKVGLKRPNHSIIEKEKTLSLILLDQIVMF